ncbi:hypothetical protein EYF80_000624 [Liparis tanakae]|uniref:Uncharacterized protein n=1 Tax=Liparis tanakae TaxID=230148 RepID=A0A4Z2JGF3_9TELE|nr:hypothetical protein EYF80_000624 [Liparis tanakae]
MHQHHQSANPHIVGTVGEPDEEYGGDLMPGGSQDSSCHSHSFIRASILRKGGAQCFVGTLWQATQQGLCSLLPMLYLSLVLGWRSKQLDCDSTALLPDKPHPRASSCSFTYSTAFFMWGPLHTSKRPVWELQWGDKQPRPS